MAIIVGVISANYLKFGISSINAILITGLITISGNYINNKLINKGGRNNYEN